MRPSLLAQVGAKPLRVGSARQRRWVRVGLAVLVFNQAFPGLWAALAPRSFFDGFPLPGLGWVSAFQPFNDHLTRDLGTLSVSTAVVLMGALLFLEPRMVTVALLSVLTFMIPHTIWHIGHSQRFSAGAIVAQIIVNASGIVVALACLRWSWRAPAEGSASTADAAGGRRSEGAA
jgi:hypothetical protein